MRVLHATRGTVDAVLAGCPILPVEGRRCPRCRGDETPTCPHCHGTAVAAPEVSGRIALAADGVIVATATAAEVLPELNGWDAAPGFPRRAVVAGTGAPVVLVAADSDDPMTPTVLAADPTVLDLSSGWVVLVEDVGPPPLAARPNENCARSKDGLGHCSHWDDCEPCCWCGDDTRDPSCDCELCTQAKADAPPVPVAAAPVGTITTWEAT